MAPTQNDWAMNQPVWILGNTPGFFHYWRPSRFGRRAQVGFVTPWGEAKATAVPEEWLTERTEGDSP